MPRDELELTILMPCLNEAETIAACIGKAMAFLHANGIAGEVLVACLGLPMDAILRYARVRAIVRAGARRLSVSARAFIRVWGSAALAPARAPAASPW